MSDFYSQAFNFATAVDGGVDTRTGLFNINIPLLQIQGNDNLGPSLPLGLSYTPLNNVDAGFGIGWALGLSCYDRKAKRISLSGGEQYSVVETPNSVTLLQQKLDSLRFQKKQDAYLVVRKSGEVEQLVGPDKASDFKVPCTLFSPLGHRLDLDWDLTRSPPRLREVKDERGQTFLKLSYPDGKTTSVTTLHVWPETSESYDITLSFQNGYLKQLKHGGSTPALAWDFTYESIGGSNLVTTIAAPTGMVQRAQYQRDVQRFPAASGISNGLPAVMRFTQQANADQPAIITDYSYSTYNYLGYAGQGGTWSNNSDYLYGMLTQYEYWCRATTDGKTVKRTYNNFHLLVSEETQDVGCTTHTETRYFAKVATGFDKQPPIFQLPQSVKVTYTNADQGSRTEETVNEFDDQGNPTSQLTPDGTLTRWAYYPAEGETGLAPAEPNGFVRLIKCQSVQPPADLGPAPLRSTRYRYANSPTVPGSRTVLPESAVLQVREDTFADDRLLTSRTTEYQSSEQSLELGRIVRIQDSLSAAQGAYVTTQAFVFSFNGERSIQTVNHDTHDGLHNSTIMIQSRLSGRVWSTTDAQGNAVWYDYDKLGRVVRTRKNPNTAFEAVSTFVYQTDDSGLPQTVASDPVGNLARTTFDGLGRTIHQEQKAADAEVWTAVSGQRYDARGRLVESITWDTITVDGAAPRVLQASETRSYDGWGMVQSIARSNGYHLISRYDPVSLTAETTLRGDNQGLRKTWFNAQGKAVRVERLNPDGSVDGVIANEYNGVGWLIRSRDELDHQTAWQYDDWGRVIRIDLPDGTTVTKRYADDSSSPQSITAINVNGVSQGSQQFDGLGRLKNSRSGERQYRYDFTHDSDPLPARITAPDGSIAHYNYITELGNAVRSVSTDGCEQRFDYQPAMGWMQNAGETGSGYQSDYHSDYNTQGQLLTESFNATGNTRRTASRVYTPNGLPLSYVDIAGASESLVYDDSGRLQRLKNNHADVDISYDATGRVARRTVTDNQSGDVLELSMTYDAFNRESSRELKSASETWKVCRAYHRNGQLSTRETWHDGQLARHEAYAYDARNRLSLYQCAGEPRYLPLDPWGKPVVQQHFSYDALDNIVQCHTEFTGGSDTATFRYDASDTNQLIEVRHDHPDYPTSIKLAYDACGRLIKDEAGRTLDYDNLGRLVRVTGAGTDGAYRYNAMNQVITQLAGPGNTRDLYYRNGQLINETLRETAQTTRFVRTGGSCVAEHRDGANAGTALLGTDTQGSVLLSRHNRETRACAYTAYGHRQADSALQSSLGFAGERLDPVSGTYHLGNGYRAYNPVLMRFNAPDSLSPFGAGGLNPYAYCVGDPINRTDPTGHLSWQAWLGIGLGVVGIVATAVTFGAAAAPLLATEGVLAAAASGASAVGVIGGLGLVADVTAIASGALESASPIASSALGWASLAFGLPGMVSGAASLARSASRWLPAAGEAAQDTARAVRGVQVESEDLVTLGGEVSNVLHSNPSGGSGITVFEDTSTSGIGRRLNIVSHGRPGALMVQAGENGGSLLTARALVEQLELSGFSMNDYSSFHIIACNSATDAEIQGVTTPGTSLGRQLANQLGKTVEAYRGPVTLKGQGLKALVETGKTTRNWEVLPWAWRTGDVIEDTRGLTTFHPRARRPVPMEF